MSKTTTLAIVGTAVVVGGILLVSTRAKAGKGTKKKPKSGDGWVDMEAPDRIRQIARPLVTELGWVGIDDYLAGKSWTESRGNSQAGPNTKDNRERGWFGMKPKTAFAHELSHLADENPNLLKDEKWAVALAAWLAFRLRGFRDAGQVVDWKAIARGWVFPHLVNDVNNTHQRSGPAIEHLMFGIEKSGGDPNMVNLRAYPEGFQFGDIADALELVGAKTSKGGIGRPSSRACPIDVVGSMPTGMGCGPRRRKCNRGRMAA